MEYKRKVKGDILIGYIFILPTLILISFIVFYPLIDTFYLSLFKTSLVLPQPKFVGWKGYWEISTSGPLWLIIKNSLIWTILVVIFQFILGLSTAILLNKDFFGRTLARGVVILPWVMPGIIAAMVWRLMYDPQLGIINDFLTRLGLIKHYMAWLGQPNTALFAVIIAAIWKGFPFSTVMYLAALQTVPPELYEAAELDGAGGWQRFINITIPQIMPVIRVTILLTWILTFNYFELVWVMTKGGPGKSSHIFPTFIYNVAFKQFRFGAASRYAVVSFLILLLFSILYIRELDKRGALD
ncbi:sugar ABC transporter permease [Candidatus Aerophobetes bacterium]|uniref:Sugar ABC transporter permease n=1 Tax=Aerophobetes bacterium TaxID=2030807 RepID=A0A662DLF8_UNCAE|nr:MAG: sugar ABC transporter permease [Candidatus Aerophobetes bacterium]